MKKILFVVALPQELKIIKEEIKALKSPFKVDFLLSWVWNYNVIYTLKDYIFTKWKPDFLINIWVCWTKSENILDFFQVYRIKNNSNNREKISPSFLKILPLKSILSSEKIITDKNDLWEENFVDMESFWVDFVCSREEIPYLIIKKPFDIISENSKKVDLKELQDSLRNFDYLELFEKIWAFLEENEKESFEKEILIFKEKFRLTFSETEMLRGYINKKISFWGDFSNIFEELGSSDKRSLIKEI